MYFNSSTLKSNQVYKLKVKEEISDLKSEKLQSCQQPEQDMEFLTKNELLKFGKCRLWTGQKNKWSLYDKL